MISTPASFAFSAALAIGPGPSGASARNGASDARRASRSSASPASTALRRAPSPLPAAARQVRRSAPSPAGARRRGHCREDGLAAPADQAAIFDGDACGRARNAGGLASILRAAAHPASRREEARKLQPRGIQGSAAEHLAACGQSCLAGEGLRRLDRASRTRPRRSLPKYMSSPSTKMVGVPKPPRSTSSCVFRRN